jgi:type IV secretory pathway VirB4 component
MTPHWCILGRLDDITSDVVTMEMYHLVAVSRLPGIALETAIKQQRSKLKNTKICRRRILASGWSLD